MNPSPVSVAPSSASAGIDILQVAPDLVRIVESSEHDARQAAVEMLAYLVRLTRARGALLVDSVAEPHAIWPETAEGPGQPDPAIRESMLHAAREASRHGGTQVRAAAKAPELSIIAAPVISEGRLRACVAIALASRKPEELQPFVVIIQASLGYLQYAWQRRASEQHAQLLDHSAALIELIGRILPAPYFEEAVRSLAKVLSQHLGEAQVAVGWVRKRRVQLLTLSGSARVDQRGRLTGLLESAMSEASTSAEPLEVPAATTLLPVNEATESHLAHEELMRSFPAERIISVPLRANEESAEAIAVITCLWTRGHAAPSWATDFLAASSEPLAGLLDNMRRQDPRGWRKWTHLFWSRQSLFVRSFWVIALLGLAGLLAWPFPERIAVDCRVEPVVRRVVSAPYAGILKEALVEPGETVEEGDLLALMDDQELTWKLAELRASRDRAIRQRDLSLTGVDKKVAAAQMAGLEAEALGLEIKLLEWQQENLDIRAPASGTILKGDLERAEGVPLEQGQVLFELAPLKEMEVELLIPSQDISRVEDGMPVTVRLESYPGREWDGDLQRIRPQAEVEDGKTLFLAEAAIDRETARVGWRAGMKGRAVIRGEPTPLIWSLTRRLRDYLYQTFIW